MPDLGTPRRTPFEPRVARRSLFQALAEARGDHGGGTVALVDGDERQLTYDEILRASFGLGSALKPGTRRGECVGVMLPTGAAATLTFFALTAFGRIPTMLNFTSGLAGLKSALRTAQVKRVVTARRLVDVAGLQDVVARARRRDRLSGRCARRSHLKDKLTAVAGKLRRGCWRRGPIPTRRRRSFSPPAPKASPRAWPYLMPTSWPMWPRCGPISIFIPRDVLFNPLPVFHCFGLTVGTLLPLIAGVKVVCHPTPLQPREIVRRIRQHGATILISTDTFINQYARCSEAGDLDSLRMAVCGAERLRDETRTFLRRKSSVTLLEGYGVTEAAPVIAANQIEANHPGTVGRLMAGMRSAAETGRRHQRRRRAGCARSQCDAGLYPARCAGKDRAARRRLVQHRRCRRDRRRRLHRHSRPSQALRQDRRRDGVPGGGGEHRRGGLARQCPCRGGGARRTQGRADRAGHRCSRSAPAGTGGLGAEPWRVGTDACRAGCWWWRPFRCWQPARPTM